MDLFVQLTVNGLTLGSIYALVALGFSLVFGILRILNFAHGAIYMVGAFLGYVTLTAVGAPANPALPLVPLLLLVIVVATTGAAGLGVIVERIAFRPLRGASTTSALLAGFGVAFFIQNAILVIFGPQFRSYETGQLGGGALFDSVLSAGPLDVSVVRALVIALAIVALVAMTLLMTRTRIGKAMRATGYDHEAAEMMGVDVNRTTAIAFLIASALAGAAGALVGIAYQRIDYLMGFLAALKGFTAAVVGGLGSLVGAVMGGLFVGLAESYVSGYVTTTFRDAVVFAILIVIMLLRPSGLLGRLAIQKA